MKPLHGSLLAAVLLSFGGAACVQTPTTEETTSSSGGGNASSTVGGSSGAVVGSSSAPTATSEAPRSSSTAAGTSTAGVSSSAGGGGSSSGVVGSSSRPVSSSQGGSSGAVPTVAKFVAIGDTGKGNDGQRAVAAAIKTWCDSHGCDFVLLLGDNIYDSGVSSVTDPQWEEKFEAPYRELNLPFYAVLGNHDYGGNGAGNQFSKGPIEVAYTQHSQKWRMPDTHYVFTHGPAGFVALDTNSLMWDNTDHGDQAQWVTGALSGLNTPWKFVLGHHPYLSNGPHGNAGNYDPPWGRLDPLGVAGGGRVKDFFDLYVCNNADFYLCGHDHSRQWLNQGCGMELVVSGGGASTTEVSDTNPKYWHAATIGFMYMEVTAQSAVGTFVTETGAVDFTRTVMR